MVWDKERKVNVMNEPVRKFHRSTLLPALLLLLDTLVPPELEPSKMTCRADIIRCRQVVRRPGGLLIVFNLEHYELPVR